MNSIELKLEENFKNINITTPYIDILNIVKVCAITKQSPIIFESIMNKYKFYDNDLDDIIRLATIYDNVNVVRFFHRILCFTNFKNELFLIARNNNSINVLQYLEAILR